MRRLELNQQPTLVQGVALEPNACRLVALVQNATPHNGVGLISVAWSYTKWIWDCFAWSSSFHMENSDEVSVLALFGNVLGVFMHEID